MDIERGEVMAHIYKDVDPYPASLYFQRPSSLCTITMRGKIDVASLKVLGERTMCQCAFY